MRSAAWGAVMVLSDACGGMQCGSQQSGSLQCGDFAGGPMVLRCEGGLQCGKFSSGSAVRRLLQRLCGAARGRWYGRGDATEFLHVGIWALGGVKEFED
jgi:hypothetical protein